MENADEITENIYFSLYGFGLGKRNAEPIEEDSSTPVPIEQQQNYGGYDRGMYHHSEAFKH